MMNRGQKKRSLLVTGASGFVGRCVAEACVDADIDLHLVSRSDPAVEQGAWHTCDLLNPKQVRDLLSDVQPDTLLHLAWCVEHGRFWTDPMNLEWVAATMTLARAAAEAGATRFVGVGTCYEYDWPSNGACKELATPTIGHTLYDVSKDVSRRVLEAYFNEVGIGFAWARLFFLYGPGETPTRLTASIARALVQGEEAPMSNGLAIRDFMDVRDAGAALASLALSEVEGPVNIGSGQGIKVSELAYKMGQLAGRLDLIRLGALSDRQEPPQILADTKKLNVDVGFTPSISLEAGLRNVLDFWASNVGKS